MQNHRSQIQSIAYGIEYIEVTSRKDLDSHCSSIIRKKYNFFKILRHACTFVQGILNSVMDNTWRLSLTSQLYEKLCFAKKKKSIC